MINFCSLEAGNEVASILQLLLVSFSSARFLGLALFYLFFLNWSLCFCLFVFCSCSCPLWCVLLLLLLLLLFFFDCSALFLSSQWGCYFLLCLLFQFFVVGVFRWLAWLSILICLLPCSLTCVLACLVACPPACLPACLHSMFVLRCMFVWSLGNLCACCACCACFCVLRCLLVCLFLSSLRLVFMYALRVLPAETRLTVYRRRQCLNLIEIIDRWTEIVI